MRLTDLEPHWLVCQEGGPHLGLTFLCPHCKTTRLGVYFHHRGREQVDDAVIHAQHPQGHEPTWTLDGPEDFEVLTLTPSVDASGSGHWHGFLTAGAAL